jgi:hypothetical protein
MKNRALANEMKIVHYCDPRHGWFKVNRALLVKLGIADKISGYSYQRNDIAYLEEDCDAGLLIKALDSKGINWSVDTKHTNRTSKIRNYSRYKVAA